MSVWLYSGYYEKQKELKASKKLFRQLPKNLKTEFEHLWAEYETRQTEEAKFVWALDKIAPRLQPGITKKDKSSNMPTNWDKVKKQDQQIRNRGNLLDEVLTKIYKEPNFERY